MGNVKRVLKRDVKRLLKTPSALIVVIAICILPSLYTWLNVAAFWNPYDNTGNIEICIVNEDAGASSELTGDIDVGSRIVDEMKGNDQLKWTFMDREEALEEVRAGRAYAAFVIPESFSADIVGLLSGNLEGPKIEYYLNEKIGPIAPKITDTGAGMLDTKINDAFVSTVSGVIAETANEVGADVQSGLANARSAISRDLAKARGALESVRGTLATLSTDATGAAGKVADLRGRVSGLSGRIAAASQMLSDISVDIGNINAGLARLTASLGVALDDASAQATKALVTANAALGVLNGKVTSVIGVVDEALAFGEAAVQRVQEVQAELDRIIAKLPSGPLRDAVVAAKTAVDERLAEEKAELDAMVALSNSLSNAVGEIDSAATQLNAQLEATINGADAQRANISQVTVPALSTALGNLSTQMAALGSSIGSQTVLINQTLALLDGLSTTLDTVATTIGDTNAMLGNLMADFDSLQADASSLGTSSLLDGILGSGGLDPGKVADFMLSPTLIQSEVLYPLNAYGSAMAPLFMNLSLWIGVFMLMVVFRLETDDEDIPGITVTQRFFGRLFLLAPIACLQAIVCCVGCAIMGVQSVNLAALIITAVIAALAYLAIQYTLSTTLQLVGMGICIILVFLQIPGASGLYPIEMTPPFFQAVYPCFPFTYGINAIRETIGGFYGFTWLFNIAILLLFIAAFVGIGVLVRPLATNLNRLFARQLEESELINIESVKVPERRFRVSMLMESIVDQDRYRAAAERARDRFEAQYPKLKLFGLIAGIGIAALVAGMMLLAGADRATILIFWLVWFIAIGVYVIAVEAVRDRLMNRLAIEGMSDAEKREIYSRRMGPEVDDLEDADRGDMVSFDHPEPPGFPIDDDEFLDDEGDWRDESDWPDDESPDEGDRPDDECLDGEGDRPDDEPAPDGPGDADE